MSQLIIITTIIIIIIINNNNNKFSDAIVFQEYCSATVTQLLLMLKLMTIHGKRRRMIVGATESIKEIYIWPDSNKEARTVDQSRN